MTPVPARRPLPKAQFSTTFGSAKTQTYYDPATRGPSHTIRTIAWNPTGHLIATGSSDRSLRIWNPEKPQVKNSTELRGHSGSVEAVAWNPTKEAELASVSTDGSCRFWDVRSKTCVATVSLGARGVSISWSSDGSLVIVGTVDRSDNEFLVPIAIPSYTAGTPIPQHGQTNQTVFAPLPSSASEHTLLISTGSGTVQIASYPRQTSGDATLRVLYTVHAHTSSCSSLALSPTGRYLATGGSDAVVGLWDTSDFACRRTLDRTSGTVATVSFSWDGSYVVASSDDGTGLDIAHVESGDYLFSIPTSLPAHCVTWHPSRYWLAYAGDPGGLKIVGAAGGPL